MIRKALISAAAAGFLGIAALAQTGTEGYYKDLFMDSGIYLTSRQRDALPCAEGLGLSMEEFVSASHKAADSTAITSRDTILQSYMIAGNPLDENGILLYPDGSPRFRMIYMNGGRANSHGRSLTEEGRGNIRQFIKGGGSYVGSCAGAFIASSAIWNRKKDSLEAYPNYLHIWPGYTTSTGLDNNQTTMTIPEDSPLLKYYDFGGDGQVDSVRHNGGCFANTEHNWPEDTEILAYYETTGRGFKYDLTGKVSIWSWKENAGTGRIVSCGSHPEGVEDGERYDLMCGMVRYALEGCGAPAVKSELKSDEEIVMKASTLDDKPDSTMIGDLQYHHFTIEVPKGCRSLTVTLSSLKGWRDFDMSLFARKGDFAFESGAQYSRTGNGFDKTLRISKPKAGTYYISVRCDTTVDSVETAYGTQYCGRLDVLNGVPYKIKATIE